MCSSSSVWSFNEWRLFIASKLSVSILGFAVRHVFVSFRVTHHHQNVIVASAEDDSYCFLVNLSIIISCWCQLLTEVVVLIECKSFYLPETRSWYYLLLQIRTGDVFATIFWRTQNVGYYWQVVMIEWNMAPALNAIWFYAWVFAYSWFISVHVVKTLFDVVLAGP